MSAKKITRRKNTARSLITPAQSVVPLPWESHFGTLPLPLVYRALLSSLIIPGTTLVSNAARVIYRSSVRHFAL